MARQSLNIAFGEGERTRYPGSVLVEMDSAPGGLNAGRTAFFPGDTAWFLIFASPNVTIKGVNSSIGQILDGVTPPSVRDEELVFDGSGTARLKTPCVGITQFSWLGASLGSLTLQEDGMTVKADRRGHAVARVYYRVAPIAKGLKSPLTAGMEAQFSVLLSVQWDHVVPGLRVTP